MVELDKNYITQLHRVNRVIYWLDLLGCGLFGWGFFFIAVYTNNIFLEVVAFLLGTLLIYRGQLFIHEVVHQRKNIKGFALAYDLLFGYPNTYPSYIHDPHLAHHGKRTYATVDDPEYYPHANDTWMKMLQPIFSSLLLPLFATLRFCLLPPIILFFPMRWKKKVYQHASTLVMRLTYIRPIRSDREIHVMMINDLLCSLYRLIFIILIVMGVFPLKIIWIWLGMFILASVLNMYRTKLAHRYLGDGNPMSSVAQLLDSVSVSGSFLSGIWAPVGLRYHSGHHLYPVIPYHNLGKLHRYLTRQENRQHPYNKTVFPSFFKAFFHFIK